MSQAQANELRARGPAELADRLLHPENNSAILYQFVRHTRRKAEDPRESIVKQTGSVRFRDR